MHLHVFKFVYVCVFVFVIICVFMLVVVCVFVLVCFLTKDAATQFSSNLCMIKFGICICISHSNGEQCEYLVSSSRRRHVDHRHVVTRAAVHGQWVEERVSDVYRQKVSKVDDEDKLQGRSK